MKCAQPRESHQGLCGKQEGVQPWQPVQAQELQLWIHCPLLWRRETEPCGGALNIARQSAVGNFLLAKCYRTERKGEGETLMA